MHSMLHFRNIWNTKLKYAISITAIHNWGETTFIRTHLYGEKFIKTGGLSPPDSLRLSLSYMVLKSEVFKLECFVCAENALKHLLQMPTDCGQHP